MEDGNKEEKRRRIPLFVGFTCGVLTCILISVVYLVGKGCHAAREAARRHERQVSDMMCCPTVWIIGLVGLPLTSAAVIASLSPMRDVVTALDASLGKCCCCFCSGRSAGTSIVIAIIVCAIGNTVLGIIDLCWIPWIHGLAAFCFFSSGYVIVGILTLSRSSDKRLTLFSLEASPALRYLKPFMLIMAILPIPIGFVDPFAGEWLAIATIGLALITVEFDIRNGNHLLFAPSLLTTTDVMASSDFNDEHHQRNGLSHQFDPAPPPSPLLDL